MRTADNGQYCLNSHEHLAANHKRNGLKRHEIDKEHRIFLQKVLDAAERLNSTAPKPQDFAGFSLPDEVSEEKTRAVPSRCHYERLASEQLGMADGPVPQDDIHQSASLLEVSSSSGRPFVSLLAKTASGYEPNIAEKDRLPQERRNFHTEGSVFLESAARKLERDWSQVDASEPTRKRRRVGMGHVPARIIAYPILPTRQLQCPNIANARESLNGVQFDENGGQETNRKVHGASPPETISSTSTLAAQAQVNQRSKLHTQIPQQASGIDAEQASEENDLMTMKQKSRRKRGPKNLECPHCDVKFRQPSAVRSHIRTVHLGERRFACPMQSCSQRFGASGDVTRHIDSVHLEKREYKCDICGARLSRNTVRYRHMRHVHGVEPIRNRASRTK